MDEDRALVEAAAAGDRDAFDALVRRHHVSIVNLAAALTGGGPDAEDLAQEVFVRVWRGLGRFRGDSSFRTWLHRVALNVIKSHFGRTARLRRLFQAPHGGSPDPADAAADPSDLERDMLRRDAIDRALGALPDDLRIAVTLRDVQGLEYREIAELTGVPVGTVESRIFRARQRLKPALASLRQAAPALRPGAVRPREQEP